MPQDFLTSAYLLTSKDVFYTREQFGQLVAYMGDALDAVALPPPAILAPQELWTGKQLFSLLVRPNADVGCVRHRKIGLCDGSCHLLCYCSLVLLAKAPAWTLCVWWMHA